jgi:hypothetical protein
MLAARDGKQKMNESSIAVKHYRGISHVIKKRFEFIHEGDSDRSQFLGIGWQCLSDKQKGNLIRKVNFKG